MICFFLSKQQSYLELYSMTSELYSMTSDGSKQSEVSVGEGHFIHKPGRQTDGSTKYLCFLVSTWAILFTVWFLSICLLLF